ncbi:hypothetical protein Tco_0056675 [Tanacetum coccineum]
MKTKRTLAGANLNQRTLAGRCVVRSRVMMMVTRQWWGLDRGGGDGVAAAAAGGGGGKNASEGEWGSGLGRSEEEEHILKLTGKLRRKSFPAAATWWPAAAGARRK